MRADRIRIQDLENQINDKQDDFEDYLRQQLRRKHGDGRGWKYQPDHHDDRNDHNGRDFPQRRR